MALYGSYRIKKVMFEWDSTKYLFKASVLSYAFEEIKSEFQLIDGEHADESEWIEGRLSVRLGFVGQMLNTSATFIDDEQIEAIAAASQIGFVDVLNALRDSTKTVLFSPVILKDRGKFVDIDSTTLTVISDNKKIKALEAEKSYFEPGVDIQMKIKTPLTAYPSWINR